MSSFEMSSTHGSTMESSISGSVKGDDDVPDGLMMTCPDSACKRRLHISEMFEHALTDHNVPLLEGTSGDVEIAFKLDPSSELYKRKVWICAALKGHGHHFVVAIETNCRNISLVKMFPYVVTHPVSKKLWLGLKLQGQDEIKYATWHECIPATQSMATAFLKGQFILIHENHLKAYGKKTMDGGVKCNFKFHILVRDCECQGNAESGVSHNVVPKVEVPSPSGADDVNVVAPTVIPKTEKLNDEEQAELLRTKEEMEKVLAMMLYIPPPSRSP